MDKNTVKYQLHLYDEKESELYCLVMDEEAHISWDEKEVQSEQLAEWWKTLTESLVDN